MKAELKGEYLFIRLRLLKPRTSKSGKSTLVASTRGPRDSGIEIKGKPVRIIANAFIDLKDLQKKKGRSKSDAPN
jgi:hypothetical protein